MASACGPRLPNLRFYLHTKFRHRLRKLPRSPRRFAQPERDAGRLAVSILNANRAGVDSQNPPRRVAELENIAGHAFDGKVFVYRSEECLARFKHDTIIRVVRDRAAGSQRDQPRATPPAHALVYGVIMNQCAAAPALCAETFRQHLQHVVKLLPRQIAIRIRGPHQVEEFLFLPIFAGRAGDDLLGQKVKRFLRHPQAVQFAVAHATERGEALDQFIATQRKQSAFRQSAALVLGAANALQQSCNRTS